MTRFLVSVRSLEEAKLAASAGVDLVDLKEPRKGSLGRVELEIAQQVAGALAPHTTLSMALGELTEWADDDWQWVRHVPAGIVFAKVGLAQCLNQPAWRETWRAAIRWLPQHCAGVAVIYADWRQAAAPRPASVIDEACRNGCRALLVDTFSKHSENVFSHCSVEELADAFDRARDADLVTVLAGSLCLGHLGEVLRLSPDYVAVRGAVCEDEREGNLSPSKLDQWITRLGPKKVAQI